MEKTVQLVQPEVLIPRPCMTQVMRLLHETRLPLSGKDHQRPTRERG